ncbi:MAG TPA: MBL fold metallo-hydrolase [Actinomycetota bacterium]|jgi:L-ascorbate metabolism protein UlaG (beta-lactamase superfamily)|nr:MBL fold metallo-hydrolase [Actinomycetota bacterium]
MVDRFTWFKQSAYRWTDGKRSIYIDPWGIPDDAPAADVILWTHSHYDHFDESDIRKIAGDDTTFVGPPDVAAKLSGDVVTVHPGETFDAAGVKGETVPAYNVAPHRQAHPKENGWVGYVIDLGGITHYFSGDTDPLPELEQVRAQVAFLCVGGDPFTMGPEEAAGLARAIEPEVAVPNHYGYEGGSASDGEAFQKAAAPVRVELLTPVDDFTLG